MSSRFSQSGESRYNQRDRDRSPPRFERRGSSSSGPIRNSDNSYRPGDSASNSRDTSGPSRGSSSGRGGGSYTSRGRGYGGRETRDGQFYRRDNDREFSRRDTERRSPPSRNRSRTPPPNRDFRDARDHRDAPLRSLDLTRVTRDSRESGPLSAVSATSEGNAATSGFNQGGFRSRGRGDWDRGSSRRNFDDRDSFRARSRSRDRWDRDRERDRDRDYDRDSRRDDDPRDRDNDRGRRDPPLRPDSRNSVTSQSNSVGGTTASERRDGPKPPPFLNEMSRRSSFAQPTTRTEAIRGPPTTQTPSSPVHYPQVPEFGAIKTSSTPVETPRSAAVSYAKEEITPEIKNEIADPTKIAPKGPKADLTNQPFATSKPFNRRPGFPEQSPVPRRYEDASAVSTPAGSRFVPSGSPPSTHTPLNRPRNVWTSPELTSKAVPTPSAAQEMRSPAEGNTPSRPADIQIPTGPRGSRDPPIRTPLSARSNKSGSMTWTNPSRPQQQPPQHKPSIMQSMHHRKDDEYPARSLTSPTARDQRPGSRSSAMGDIMVRKPSSDLSAARRLTLSPGMVPSAIQGLRANDEDDEDDEDAIDDEDEDDEDNAELDQQDFERTEAKFKKQIESLQAKLAPSPRSNPTILAALDLIDVYASAIQDYKNGYQPSSEVEEKERPRAVTISSPTVHTRPTTMPTPPAETTQIKHEDSKTDVKDVAMLDLSLDGLTYLEQDPLTPASFDFSGSETDEIDLCDRIRQKLAIDEDEDEQLREQYGKKYLSWREDVDRMDEETAQQEALATRAATPMSAVGTETAGTPVPEGGRRATRNATEMDVERILKETAEEAQAAAEMAQVTVDMSVEPDMSREADIPDMLTEEDQELFSFEDLNNRIPNVTDSLASEAPEDNPVFKAFDYLPPEDDFDSDDQERFKDAYAKFPKQWGFLANNMNVAALQIEPGEEKVPPPKLRDYHQCILHYYMTKKQAKPAYKLLPTRKSRGKKKTAAGSRRGANQRSSMLGNGEDGTGRVTDTGRPKRAAAPNFNDKEKREAEALAQKAAAKEKKAASTLNKPATDGSGVSEKTPVKRVSRKKEGEKTTKKTAKTALAPNGPTAQNLDQAQAGRDVQMQDAYRSRDMEGAQLLADLHAYANQPAQQTTTFPGGSQNETWRVDPRIQAPSQGVGGPVLPQQSIGMATLDPGLQQPGALLPGQNGAFMARQLSPGVANLQAAANPPATSNSRSANGTSSYWSVVEQTRFLELVKIYGKNWEMIGKCLPSKSEQMIRNNFDRGGRGSGHDAEARQRLEEFALEAERRIAREGLPPPPEPVQQSAPPANGNSRRRGAGTASQRTLAPNPDHATEVILPGSGNTDARNRAGLAVSQGSPQDHTQPTLAPARPVIVSVAPAADALVAGRSNFPGQISRAQPGIASGQIQPSPYAHVEAERIRTATGIPRESMASMQSLQSKRPRSITEQDRHLQEQPPKRQGLSLEEFTSATAIQHEIQQQQQQQLQAQQQVQQQRAMHRSDSQQSYDYRQPMPKANSGYPQVIRNVSNPEDIDRNRGRPPSPQQYHKKRDSYGGQYPQAVQPSHPGSMASVMGGPRGILGSPGHRAPAELPRPVSVAATSSGRPTPAPPQKRSNIMSLLNDDPPEEKKSVETRPAVPTRHDSPMTNAPMYQTPSQPVYQRREVIDPVRDTHNQRNYAPPPSYSSPATQPQSYSGPPAQAFIHPQHQHQQPPPQPREQYQRSYYADPPRSYEPSRPMYQHPPQAASPPPPSAQQNTYHSSRSGYEAPAHSRATSYSMHSNPSATGPGQALNPSPYAAIRPSNLQSINHHTSATAPQPIYHPGNQGPPTMTGSSRAATAYPVHDQRRIEDHTSIRRYGTPSHTPPNNGAYGYAPPQ